MEDVDFVLKAVGKPWKNRAEGGGAYDCWGLVVASYREIEGIEMPVLAGFLDENCPTHIAAEQMDMSKFNKSGPVDGAIMLVYDNKRRLLHVGRCLCGKVVHSTTSLGVVASSYRAMKSKFKNLSYVTYD